jgi:hypothetical protein
MSLCEPLPQRQERSLYSQGRHDPSVVGRPQQYFTISSRRSAVIQCIIADDIGAHGTETIFAATVAEQHEIKPLGEIGLLVGQVLVMSPGITRLPGMCDGPGIRSEQDAHQVYVHLVKKSDRPQVRGIQ